MSLDVASIRQDFPVLHRLINDKPLVYLDSANTSQKPQVVIDALSNFMSQVFHALGVTPKPKLPEVSIIALKLFPLV